MNNQSEPRVRWGAFHHHEEADLGNIQPTNTGLVVRMMYEGHDGVFRALRPYRNLTPIKTFARPSAAERFCEKQNARME